MIFHEMFDRLHGHEGGYVNDKNDSGMETNWGISKRSYPHLDIKNLTKEQAKTIYFKDFWTPLKGDDMYDGVAWQLLDFAVNSGLGTAIRIYQRAIGVADDGHFGPHSLAAANKMSESDQIMRLVAERLRFMVKCKSWQHHGGGWVNRMAKNLYYGSDDS